MKWLSDLVRFQINLSYTFNIISVPIPDLHGFAPRTKCSKTFNKLSTPVSNLYEYISVLRYELMVQYFQYHIGSKCPICMDLRDKLNVQDCQ